MKAEEWREHQKNRHDFHPGALGYLSALVEKAPNEETDLIENFPNPRSCEALAAKTTVGIRNFKNGEYPSQEAFEDELKFDAVSTIGQKEGTAFLDFMKNNIDASQDPKANLVDKLLDHGGIIMQNSGFDICVPKAPNQDPENVLRIIEKWVNVIKTIPDLVSEMPLRLVFVGPFAQQNIKKSFSIQDISVELIAHDTQSSMDDEIKNAMQKNTSNIVAELYPDKISFQNRFDPYSVAGVYPFL